MRSEGRQDKGNSKTMVRFSWNRERERENEVLLFQGPVRVQLSSPQDYLKKHSKELKLPESELYTSNDSLISLSPSLPLSLPPSLESRREPNAELPNRRPLVPPHTEQPQMGSKSNQNYIKTNAVNNIMAGIYDMFT